MLIKKKRILKTRLFVVGFLLLGTSLPAQLLEIDYNSGKREEESFRIQLIRTGIIGISSLKHLDLTLEVLKLRYDTKRGTHFEFTVFGTQTLWRGNRVDELNTFDFLMNPIGGTINGSLFGSFALNEKELSQTKLAFSIGSKWIEGPPLPNFQNTSFLDYYGRLGWIYQKTIAEDALTNSSLYFWTFPSLLIHQSSEQSRQQFFNNQLDPLSYGYALELGLEYNTQLKITLVGQQLVNADPSGNFGRFVARLIVGYRF